MERVQQRVQTISHEFNAQNTASTLWALARIGEPQGERMMALLYMRAEETCAQLKAQVNPEFTCFTTALLVKALSCADVSSAGIYPEFICFTTALLGKSRVCLLYYCFTSPCFTTALLVLALLLLY